MSAFQKLTILSKWHRFIGPGLLYAGASVGVSHLIQSTRAGAEYGWWPLWAIVFIHLAKYPFFKMGPQYAMRTGHSLIQGYFKLGWWAVGLFLLYTAVTMWAIIAAVTAVTAGIAGFVFGLSADTGSVSAVILAICAAILLIGKYKWLDRSMTYIIVILSVSTLAAFIIAMVHSEGVHPQSLGEILNGVTLLMLVKLMGWMPAPLDISVWHSIWTLEKQSVSKGQITYRQSMTDFNLGYWGTMVLAMLFLGMGVFSLYGSGVHLPDAGVGFSKILLGMYTSQLGVWSFAIVAAAALATMFSTVLTCLDAIPRSLAETWNIAAGNRKSHRYMLSMALVIGGALALLTIWNPGMITMVDLATVLSFVGTPAYAWLNLRTVQKELRERGESLSPLYLSWCWISIAILASIAIVYLIVV